MKNISKPENLSVSGMGVGPVVAFCSTTEQGAQTTLYCALVATTHETGLYYDKCQIKTPTTHGLDNTQASKLWDQSMHWVAPFV